MNKLLELKETGSWAKEVISTYSRSTSGGIYIISGPNWNDTIPNDMLLN
jgi:hypothetical protein